MDKAILPGAPAQAPTDAARALANDFLYCNESASTLLESAQPSLQAASERVKTDAGSQLTVQPSVRSLSEPVEQPEKQSPLPADRPVVGIEEAGQQSGQPVITAQSEQQATQLPLRRSMRERRKPAVLVESADEAALTAAAYAAPASQPTTKQQDDPFSDFMLLIEAATALSSAADAGLTSPQSEAAVRAASVPNSHQSSSTHNHDPTAVAEASDAAGHPAYDAASGMAALAIHRLSSQEHSPNPNARSRNGQGQAGVAGQLGRSNSSNRRFTAGIPPTSSRSRKGTPPVDAAAAAAAGTYSSRGSRRGSAGGFGGDSYKSSDAAGPIPKRSSEVTGSLPNLKPRGQGRWQVFLCAQGLKYLYVGQYDDLPSAKHARDLAVLAVHGPRLVPTLNPIESYTHDRIAVVRQQMAEKPAARAVMVANGLWPPAGQDITAEELQQEKRSRRLPGLQHLVPLAVKSEAAVSEAGFEPGLQQPEADPAAAAAAPVEQGLLAEAAAAAGSQQVDMDLSVAAAAAPQDPAAAAAGARAPRMRASVATTLALAAAAAGSNGGGSSSQVKVEQDASALQGVAAAAANTVASLQHYHARATANPTGMTGIREHKGVFEVFLATPPFKYLYVGRAATLQQAVHLKATAQLAIYGPLIAKDQFGIDLSTITAEEVHIMAGKLANKPAALAAMRQYGTDVMLLPQQQYGQQQQRGRRYSSRSSDAGSHNQAGIDAADYARILAAAVAAAAAMAEDDYAAAGSSRKRSAGGCSDAGSAAAAAAAAGSGDMDDWMAAAAAAGFKRRHIASSSGGGSSSGGASSTTAHCLQDLFECLQQQQQQQMYDLSMMDAQQVSAAAAAAGYQALDPAELAAMAVVPTPAAAAEAAVPQSPTVAAVDPASAAAAAAAADQSHMAAAAAADSEEGDAEASLTIATRRGPSSKSAMAAAAASPGAAAAVGVVGVRAHKGGYETFIGSPPFKYLYVGLYKTLEMAIRAKDTAMVVLYGSQAASMGLTVGDTTDITTGELQQMAVRLSKKSQAVQAMKKAGMYYLVDAARQQQQQQQEGGQQHLLTQQQQQQQQHALQQQMAELAAAVQGGFGFDGQQQQQQQGQQQQDGSADCLLELQAAAAEEITALQQQQQEGQQQDEGSMHMEVDALPPWQQQQQVEAV